MAQRVQSHQAASVPEHASTYPRNSKSNWYSSRGLDIFIIQLFGNWVGRKNFNKTLLIPVVVIPIGFYILFFKIFYAKGVYDTYNQIRSTTFVNLIKSTFTSPFWTSFILPFLIIGVVSLIFAFVVSHHKKRVALCGWKPLAFFGLAVAVAGPYVLAGKHPPSYNILSGLGLSGGDFTTSANYNYRHAMLPYLCAVFGLVGAISAVKSSLELTKILNSVVLGAFFIPFLAMMQPSLNAWKTVFDRDAEISKLIKSMDVQALNSKDVCKIDLTDYPLFMSDMARPYELHHYATIAGADRSTYLVGHNITQPVYDRILKIICTSQDHKEKYAADKINCPSLLAAKYQIEDVPLCY